VILLVALLAAEPLGRCRRTEVRAAVAAARCTRRTAGSADGSRTNITNVMKLTTNSSRIDQSSRRMM